MHTRSSKPFETSLVLLTTFLKKQKMINIQYLKNKEINPSGDPPWHPLKNSTVCAAALAFNVLMGSEYWSILPNFA